LSVSLKNRLKLVESLMQIMHITLILRQCLFCQQNASSNRLGTRVIPCQAIQSYISDHEQNPWNFI